MPIIIGEGEYLYEVIEKWGKLPDGWRYGEVAAVGVDSKDNVYVFSRGKHPMIVFDHEGNFGESGPSMAVNVASPGIGPRVSLWTLDGKRIARVGDASRQQPSQFTSPHGVAVDSRGDIYVGEVARTAMRNKGTPIPEDQDIRCMQKLVKQ